MDLAALIMDNRTKKVKQFALPVDPEKIASEFGYGKEDILFTIQSIEELPELKVEGSTLTDLNKLSKNLRMIDKDEVLTFIELNSDDLSVLLEFNFYECGLFPEVTNDFELGQYMVRENGFNMAYFLKYFDYEKYGRDVRLEESGTFTDRGYFVPKVNRL